VICALHWRDAEDEAMSFTNYRCKHCAQTTAIDTSRIVKAHVLRCDACFALSSLPLSERLALINAAVQQRPAARKWRSSGHAASA
jgi:hypothetical protein